MINKWIGFTGTREGLTERQEGALREWMKLSGMSRFHHGLCIGADEQAHRIARTLPGVQIIGHPPIKTAYMMPLDTREFYQLRPAKPYLRRNLDIVSESQHLLVCPKGAEAGFSGTWSTVRYARNVKVPITIVWPDGSFEEELP